MATTDTVSRRLFVATTAAVLAAPAVARAADPQRKIKLGVVGNGGRGGWIANLFKQHGGYEMHAVGDYFQAVADKCGEALGVDPSRRFFGLSAYQKVIASGVEAIALETPPCFFPEHVKAAVDAGLHVYMAKPIAVDVPGTLTVEAAAKKATDNKKVFLVDYQMPTDPINLECVARLRNGALGASASSAPTTTAASSPTPPSPPTSRAACSAWSGATTWPSAAATTSTPASTRCRR
ncbi:MAG: Gfo/Idh/MocA family oxidoreductase [Verrucomicrobiota bacterium]